MEQGHTVFMVSWVNPDASSPRRASTTTCSEGVYAALDAIEKATGEKEVNAIGYCLGGTLLATTLAHMAAKGDDRIKSATYFATMTDFSRRASSASSSTRSSSARSRRRCRSAAILEGREMATTFNMLRANDLIWSFVVNNYLLGQEPFPFDLLYWNDDSTRMPARMHSFYLRRMYQQNDLVKPGAIELLGEPIDLRKIKTPTYMLSTREDHIAPWKSTYRAHPDLWRPDALRPRRLRPHRRRRQPARGRQVQPLGQREAADATRTSGSPARPSSPGPGGRTGSAGSPRCRRSACPRAPREARSFPRSRTRPEVT